MVFSFTKNRSFVREHFSVSQLEHTYSFIHARNFLGIELSYAEENVLIYICLQKWAISFRSYYLSKIRDLRTSSENSSKILATTLAVQYKQYSRVQKLARNFEFRTEDHQSLAGNVLYINLNVICAIQIISATLLVISIRELKNIEPLPLVHMWKVATELLKQLFVLKEMPEKAWLPHQRNAFHPYEETEVEHTIELNSCESICLEHFNARALIYWLTMLTTT